MRMSLHSELFVEQWNVGVPLGLIEIASDWRAQVVFLNKLLDLEAATIVAWSVGQAKLIECQLAGLLVDEENIAMKTYEEIYELIVIIW